jgi:RimJ/RimL family protein N-acetyltransferase
MSRHLGREPRVGLDDGLARRGPGRRVWLEVYEYNKRGLRVYENVGFRVEGRLRQDTFREGRYWDTILMGILREEWQPAQPTA